MCSLASDFIGEKRGKLTILSISSRVGKRGQVYINCKCDCGKKTEARLNNFKAGKGLSCGCNQRKNTHLNRVNIVISNEPAKKTSISGDRLKAGNSRRAIEDIQAAHALKRELSSWL